MTTIYDDRQTERELERANVTYSEDAILSRLAFNCSLGRFQHYNGESLRHNFVIIITDDIMTLTVIGCTYHTRDYSPCKQMLEGFILDSLRRGLADRLRVCEDVIRREVMTKIYPDLAREHIEGGRAERRRILDSVARSDIAKAEWDEAVEWARGNGAKIRRSSRGYNKHTVRIKVAEAGLMDSWNERYPSRAFTDKDLEESREYIRARDERYEGRRNHRGK